MVYSTEKYQRASITWRKDYTEDLWSIRIQPEQRLGFKPGQYATLGVEENGRMVERAYSICSSPFEDEVEFFFELVREGQLTPPLYLLKTGDAVLLRRQAKGLFTLDRNANHRLHFLVCTVTGVAPYVSIVRTLASEEEAGKRPDVKLVLLHAASRSREFAYDRELEGFARRCAWFQYIPTVSRLWEEAYWAGEVGRAEDVLRKYLDSSGAEPSNTAAYLCGHPQMIENAKGILLRRGFAKESIRQEVYWVPKKEGVHLTHKS
jgi:ferredoxin--NADP+ reductase